MFNREITVVVYSEIFPLLKPLSLADLLLNLLLERSVTLEDFLDRGGAQLFLQRGSTSISRTLASFLMLSTRVWCSKKSDPAKTAGLTER
eukprot:1196267-Prorocentrum_minimum.AAC.7